MTEAQQTKDIAALAKGGRTNFLGFLLRLAARMPFLFIAGRLYGQEALGRFALALVAVELTAQLCTLGQRRSLAQKLAAEGQLPVNIVADAMLLGAMLSVAASLVLFAFPQLIYRDSGYQCIDLLIAFTVVPATLTEIALAALAYRFDIAATVRARAIVEPWTLSIMAGVFWLVNSPPGLLPACLIQEGVRCSDFTPPASGLLLAYDVSIFAAAIAALWPLFKSYGLPQQWRPHPLAIWRLAAANLPLAAADAVEWGTRRFDIFILGFFAGDSVVGVYYVAQQIASLPQKLKTSFEPILGPVITRNLRQRNFPAIARQVSQVGFWITAMQAGLALAIGITSKGWMGLTGPGYVPGALGLNCLLVAEVLAATAVVSEAVLIYVAPIRNVWISLSTLIVQALSTVFLIRLMQQLGYDEMVWGAMAGAGLIVALGFSSLVKSLLLAHILKERVNNWRWPLFLAAIPASILGWAVVNYMPEWAQLTIGAEAVLVLYGAAIWHWGFGPEDRMLFRKGAAPDADESAGDKAKGEN